MVVIMLGWLTTKVKQPLLTAVCREWRKGLLVDRVAALEPGGRSAIDVGHLAIPEGLEVARRGQAALPAVADRVDGPVARDLIDPLLQLTQRNQLRARDVTRHKFPGLPNVDQERHRVHPKSVPQLSDRDCRDLRHLHIL